MKTPDRGVRCMLMRGGTSKGTFFVEEDLPSDPDERDQLLMQIMGTPDPRQIDGVGGAHPLTSKVAIASRSSDGETDIEYLFLQLGVDEAMVTDRQNCGNLLAAIGPFAVERRLVDVPDGAVSLRIRMRNTGGIAVSSFEVEGGLPVYEGETAISGVPGTAARIDIDFVGIAGGTTGALLPTGHVSDVVEGVPVSLVDNGMPVVVMRAEDLGITGYEPCRDLQEDTRLRERLEAIRLCSGEMMGLGDVSGTTIPKLTMVAPPKAGGSVCTRTFIPHRCHDAIGVLGAVSVATACLIPGSPAAEVTSEAQDGLITLEHPTGSFDARVVLEQGESGVRVERAGIVRTARKLMDGVVYPRSY